MIFHVSTLLFLDFFFLSGVSARLSKEVREAESGPGEDRESKEGTAVTAGDSAVDLAVAGS